MVWRSTATRTRERKRSDPQRVLLGCRCLASAGQLQGRLKERYVKRGGGRGGGELLVGDGAGRAEEDQYLVGHVKQKGAGEGGRQRATRSWRDQSIGRFSPCFFVNSSAFFKNFLRSFEYSSARSALRGCSGWGSFTSAMRDWITERHEGDRVRHKMLPNRPQPPLSQQFVCQEAAVCCDLQLFTTIIM